MASAPLLSPGRPAVSMQLGYSLGNLGKSVVLTVFDTFLLYYLVRIAGVAPLAAGGLLGAVMLWDGAADVGVAFLTDRSGHVGALRRLVLIGSPLCAISFWLIFTLPPADGSWPIALAVMLCRAGFALCDIGHNTLIVRFAADPRIAAGVSGMRLICSAGGVGLVGLATAAILTAPPAARAATIAVAAMIGGALYAGTLLVAVVATRRLPVPPTPGGERRSAAAVIGDLWRNPPFRRLLCLLPLQSGLVPLFVRALAFTGEATRGGAQWAGPALATIALAQALSLPVWMIAARWRRPQALLVLAHGAMLVALAMLAATLGAGVDAIGLTLIGIAQAGMNMAIWAMLAIAVHRGAGEGVMDEALPVGVFLAVIKASGGLGHALLALVVAAAACPRCGATPGMVATIAWLLPALGCGGVLWLVRGGRRSPAPLRVPETVASAPS